MSAVAVVATADEARALTDRIKSASVAVWDLVTDAYETRAWAALGYATWEAYCAAEFDAAPRLDRVERQAVVQSMRESNMSIRAIAAATGASKNTIESDIKQVSQIGTPAPKPNALLAKVMANYGPRPTTPPPSSDPDDTDVVDAELVEDPPAPQAIVGTDGKTYKVSKKPTAAKPNRKPLTDASSAAGWDLRKAVERIERILADDRFTANKEQVAAHLCSHLSFTITACQGLIKQLTTETETR